MTDIQAPDGTIARFPDGMPDEEILAVMREHYPPPVSGGPQSPLGVPMPTAADLAAKGVGQRPTIGAETDALNNIVRSVAGGMTLGLDDRIAAGLGAATGIGGQQGDYADNLRNQQAQTFQFREQQPAVSIGGSMLGTGLGGAVLKLPQAATAFGRLLMGGGIGGVTGAVQGASQSPDLTDIPQTVGGALHGAELGAIGGAAAPALGSMIGRAITPLPIGLPRATEVAFMQQAGTPLSAGQITGYKPLHVLESVLSEMPFSGAGAAKLEQRQKQAYASALLRRTGIEGDRADPATLDAGKSAFQDRFRNLSSNNVMGVDQPLMQEGDDALAQYLSKVSPSNAAPLPAKLIDDLRAIGPGETLPGEAYQAQRSSYSNDAKAMRMSDPPQAQFYRQLRDAMDAAAERSIRPEDAGKWADLRKEYGAFRDILTAAPGAGSDAALGMISPQKMRQVIASGNNKFDYAVGKGLFADIVRAGNAVMTPFPNAGTAGRINAMSLLRNVNAAHLMGAGIGGAEGYREGGPTGALIGAIAGPAVAGHVLMSRPVQGYLGNQLLPGGIDVPTLGSAVAAALAARLGQ